MVIALVKMQLGRIIPNVDSHFFDNKNAKKSLSDLLTNFTSSDIIQVDGLNGHCIDVVKALRDNNPNSHIFVYSASEDYRDPLNRDGFNFVYKNPESSKDFMNYVSNLMLKQKIHKI